MGLLDGLYRVGEPALGLLSGAVAEPVAGWAGLLGGGAEGVQRTRNAMTYQPRTQAGREGQNALARLLLDGKSAMVDNNPPVRMAVDGFNALADRAGAVNPLLGAAIKSMPAAVGLLAGPGSQVPRNALAEAVKGTGRTLGPKAAEMMENHLLRTGGILPITDDLMARLSARNTVSAAINNEGGLLGHNKPEMKAPPPDYMIDHRPMKIEGGAAPLHDLAPVFGDDIYGRNALQYFGSGDPREAKVLQTLRQIRGNPDAPVTIYRGVPDGVDKINPGDWVTIHPEVAADYGRVLQMQVPASHITSWPDSLLEFGYWPPVK